MISKFVGKIAISIIIFFLLYAAVFGVSKARKKAQETASSAINNGFNVYENLQNGEYNDHINKFKEMGSGAAGALGNMLGQ